MIYTHVLNQGGKGSRVRPVTLLAGPIYPEGDKSTSGDSDNHSHGVRDEG